MKMLFVTVVLGIQALALSGCASGYTRPPEAGAATFKATRENPISSVSIELTDEVKEKLKDSLKFDKQVLGQKIELALQNRELLNKEKKEADSIDITITHVRVRNTFNAVMWGAMSGNDSIHGDVKIKDPKGLVVDQFHVDTSYALGGFAGGQDSARINWLYDAFAKQVVSALAGDPQKNDQPAASK